MDHLLWYAQDRQCVKYRSPYLEKVIHASIDVGYDWIEEPDGKRRPLGPQDKKRVTDGTSQGYRVCSLDNLTSQSGGLSTQLGYEFCGEKFFPATGGWKTNFEGMKQLQRAQRVEVKGTRLRFVRYFDDFRVTPLSDSWPDTVIGGFIGDDKVYVVQTSPKVIQRCVLRTTDPGDLVLDPTCVRKGTRVWGVDPTPTLPVHGEGEAPLNPPVDGGAEDPTSILPACGEEDPTRNLRSGGEEGRQRGGMRGDRTYAPSRGRTQTMAPSPWTGRAASSSRYAGVKASAPSPWTGRAGVGLVPIEDLKPGDWVLGHDGQPHRVLRSIVRRYKGWMIGLQHGKCGQTLWVTGDHLVLTSRKVRSLGRHGQWGNVPKENFGRARSLRKEMSAPERILWSRLRDGQLGVKFRRQHPIGPYIADFYSRQAALVVEVDGSLHGEPEAAAYDAARDRFMEHLGLRVLRFTASEVVSNPDGVAGTVADASVEAVLPEDESKQWRRADAVRIGDLVYHGPEQTAVPVCSIAREETLEEVYDLEVEGAHSFLTEVCAVHNCGSGTTAYVAEQWGRRWITIDTSRVALALARTRLMAAKYPYYLLADSPEGLTKEADRPRSEREGQKTLTCGRFEMMIIENLKRAGVQNTKKNERLVPGVWRTGHQDRGHGRRAPHGRDLRRGRVGPHDWRDPQQLDRRHRLLVY